MSPDLPLLFAEIESVVVVDMETSGGGDGVC